MARQTSIETFNKIKESGLLSKLRFLVYEALYNSGPLTASELYYKCFKHQYRDHSITPRFSELKRMGVIVEIGEKYCSTSGNMAIVWDVTDNLPEKFEKKKSKDQIIKELSDEIKELKQKLYDVVVV